MDSLETYALKVRKLLNPDERRLFSGLRTPQKIQDLLDTMPINFDQTLRSPRHTLERNSTQCIEGAILCAAALAYHGHPPLLLDLRTTAKDDDHVVALFKVRGCWGAVSKTNHAILRWRDPIYTSVRELAMSYFNEYFMDSGEKTLREFSRPFDLRRFAPETWITAQGDLWWLALALDDSPHTKILPTGMTPRKLRYACTLERTAVGLEEWKKPGILRANDRKSKDQRVSPRTTKKSK